MQETSQLKRALEAADAVLEHAAKIEVATATEVEALPPLIEARLETERAFRSLETRAAIGEKAASSELGRARKTAVDATAALREASLRLGGFRAARGDLGPDLCGTYDSLKAALPGHEARIKADFAREWAAAEAVFSATVNRRAGIEKLLGKMELPVSEAAPSPAGELAEIGLPYERLRELQGAIERITEMGEAAKAPENVQGYVLPGRTLPRYDPDEVFVIVRDNGFKGQARFSKVVDASFDRGWLEYLVLAGDAKPVQDMEEPGVAAAVKKSKQIEREAKEKRERDEQAEALERAGFKPQTTRRYDLERLAEINYGGMEEERLRKQQEIDARTHVQGGVPLEQSK